jgi:hypothetical protein
MNSVSQNFPHHLDMLRERMLPPTFMARIFADSLPTSKGQRSCSFQRTNHSQTADDARNRISDIIRQLKSGK